MKSERINELLTNLQEKLDDTSKALISEEIASIITENEVSEQDFNNMTKELADVKEKNSNLIEVNGKIMQKISMHDEKLTQNNDEKIEKEVSFTDLFDSKRKI